MILKNKEHKLNATIDFDGVSYLGEVHIQCVSAQQDGEIMEFAIWRFTSGGITKDFEISLGLWDSQVCSNYDEAVDHMLKFGVTINNT